MKNTTEIDTAIESLSAGAKGLQEFYEEVYEESIDDFDASKETASTMAASRKSGLWMKITILRNMVESLQAAK
jgi:hypothetical protein